jgi:hypothetical protein
MFYERVNDSYRNRKTICRKLEYPGGKEPFPAGKRLSATWTLEQVISEEAARLKSIILKQDPSWTYGKPFDTSILDEESNGLNVYA